MDEVRFQERRSLCFGACCRGANYGCLHSRYALKKRFRAVGYGGEMRIAIEDQ